MSATVETEPILSSALSAHRSYRTAAYTVVRIVLGLLLLTAAGLKLYGLNVSALPRAGWFASPQVQLIAVQWEAVLGIWLLSGAYLFGSCIAAATTFTLFAIVSGYFGWTGITNCGCLETIKTTPWAAFVIDMIALVLIIKWAPDLTLPRLSFNRSAGMLPLCVGGFLIGLTAVGSMVYGSPSAALARLRGQTITAKPDYLDFGSAAPSEVREAVIELYNWSDEPVTLIGGTSDCSCMTTVDLPITIRAGEHRLVRIQMKLPKAEPGVFTRIAELWTDCATQRAIRLRLGAQISDSQ